jgi:hypothetical protein
MRTDLEKLVQVEFELIFATFAKSFAIFRLKKIVKKSRKARKDKAVF